MKYLYHGFVCRSIDPALLPQAEVIREPGDLAPATQVPAEQMALMEMPQSALRAIRTRGHAMPPGSGPAGETCRSCAHLVRLSRYPRNYLKCALMRAKWSKAKGTDVRAKDPACAKWTRS